MKKKAVNVNTDNRSAFEKFCSAQENKARISLIVAAAVVVATIGSVCTVSIALNREPVIPSDNVELNAAQEYLAQAAIDDGLSNLSDYVSATETSEEETTVSLEETMATKHGGLTGEHVIDVSDLKSLSDKELVDAIVSGQAGVIDRSNIETDQSQNENAGHMASGGNVTPTSTPSPTPTVAETSANTDTNETTSNEPGIKVPNASITSTVGETVDPMNGVYANIPGSDNVTSGISYSIVDASGQTISLEDAQQTVGQYTINYSYQMASGVPDQTVVDYELGIDVSQFQGDIDWTAVRNSGITFAFIRCGGRGYSQGGIYDDTKFFQNVQNAKAAGIKVGVYFFSQAITPYEALEEASITLAKISGLGIDLPVVMDWETGSGYRTWELYGEDFANVITAFCSTIAQNGYTPCVYLNTSDINSRLGGYSGTILSKYKLWYAYPYSCYNDGSYYKTGDTTPPRSFYYEYWQYSWRGSVPGIKTDVDLNIKILGKTTISTPGETLTASAVWEVAAATVDPTTPDSSVDPSASSDTSASSSDTSEVTPGDTPSDTSGETSGDTPGDTTGDNTGETSGETSGDPTTDTGSGSGDTDGSGADGNTEGGEATP